MTMPMEISSERVICTRCGRAFGKRIGFFQTSYAALHKGLGYLPVCKACVDDLFKGYLAVCGDQKTAVRQMCRKLDLYWNEKIYAAVEKKNTQRTIIGSYISKSNTANFAGKSYDDTLSEEGTLWKFSGVQESSSGAGIQPADIPPVINNTPKTASENIKVSKATIDAWGAGYTPEMYHELDKRYAYWLSQMNLKDDSSLDIGTKALLRQICPLELDINRDRNEGKPVDKAVTVLNNLLGSLNWKPVQKKQDDADSAMASTPLGVWLYRYENERPLPEIDEKLKDTNKIRKYVFTWMGHLCKMLGAKNAFSKLYEDEVAKLRVENPEYDDDNDDDTFMNELLEGTPSDSLELLTDDIDGNEEDKL